MVFACRDGWLCPVLPTVAIMRRAQLIVSLLVVGGVALAVPGVPQAAGRPEAPRPAPERARPAAPGDGPVIRSVTVIPNDPVVRAKSGVDLVVEVVARGAAGPDAVTVRVDPGPPPPPPPRRPQEPPQTPPQTPSQTSPPASSQTASQTSPQAPPAASAGRLGGAWDARDGWETWRFRAPVKLSRSYPAGVWTVEARAVDATGRSVTAYETFLLRGATGLRDLRVTPEDMPATAARGVRVSGKLTRLDPLGLGGQRGFRGRQVAIQYLSPQVGGWRTALWTVTGRGGEFAATVPAHDAVRWRVVFEGDDRHAPVSGQAG